MEQYLQLFLRGIKPARQAGNSLAVAFTSAVPGEGVSYVTQSFGIELAKRAKRNTIIADIETLKKIDIFHYSRVSHFCRKTDVPNLFVLQEDDFPDVIGEKDALATRPTAGSEIEQGVSNLNTLKFMFDFILVDCPSVTASAEAAFFASAVDGAILVVEAEKTRKEQVRSAISTMELAEAKVLGCVLNKRRYPIPSWLYRRI